MKKKDIRKKIKKNQWIILLAITIVVAMYIYGMTSHYFPFPVHLGFGQYMDISTGVVIIGLLLSGVILNYIFKTRRDRISTGEYQSIGGLREKKPKKK